MPEKLQIVERQKDALQKLNEIAAISKIIPKETLRQALEVGKEHFGLELAIVSHIVGEQYTVEVQSSPPDTLYDGQLFSLGYTYCNTTLELDDALMIEDVNRSKYIGHPCYREYKLVSYIGAPVRVNGEVYGTINFSSPNPYKRAYDETDAEFIRLLARWAGSFLEKQYALDALKALNESLEQKVKLAIQELRNKDQIMIQQSKMAAMGEMVGAIAHQWKQPLNSLSLIVQDMQMAFLCGELNEEYMQNTANSSVALIKYMSKTIDDFRNFFRPDKEKVLFLASNIVMQTISIVQTQLNENNISLEVIELQNGVEILGYPNELMQVLLNIINNAKDALLEKQIEKPLITISISSQNEQAIICIKDNAGGISGNLLESIFEPFFTTKSKEHGTGIGLSISKTIIEQNMNGTLSAKNISDGMEFKIAIPC